MRAACRRPVAEVSTPPIVCRLRHSSEAEEVAGKGSCMGEAGAEADTPMGLPCVQSFEKASLTCFKCGGKGQCTNVCPRALISRTVSKLKDSTTSVSSAQTSGNSDKGKPSSATPATVEAQAQSAFIEEVWSAIDKPSGGTPSPIFERVEIDCLYLAAQCKPLPSPAPAPIPPIPASVDVPLVAATAAADDTGSSDGLCIEVYNSGALQHMTPHHNCLSNFRAISPHPIHAANGQLFYATGEGDMWIRQTIEMPERGGFKRNSVHLRLRNILYAPVMHVTLISLGCLERNSFTNHLAGR